MLDVEPRATTSFPPPASPRRAAPRAVRLPRAVELPARGVDFPPAELVLTAFCIIRTASGLEIFRAPSAGDAEEAGEPDDA